MGTFLKRDDYLTGFRIRFGRSCLPIHSNFPRRIVQEMKNQGYGIRGVRRKSSSFSSPFLDVKLQSLGRIIRWMQCSNKRTLLIPLTDRTVDWLKMLDATITV